MRAVDSDCPQRRLDLLPSGFATRSRPLGDLGQVEKLASICQADPGVSHLDVVLALVLVRFLRERRTSRRRPPRALGSSPPGFIGFGLHEPSSLDGPPTDQDTCFAAAVCPWLDLAQGIFVPSTPWPNCSKMR